MSNFKLHISLRRAADDGPVFQKQDGGRFDKNITVKLNVNTKYTVFITSRPAKLVQRVLFKGEKLEMERQKPERNDDNCCVYHADWSTAGYEVSKSNIRTYLPLLLELENGVMVESKLQVKFYPETEATHSKWGQEFHMLDLTCSITSGETNVTVLKEEYI